MKGRGYILILLAASISLIYGCLDPYNPPATQNDVNYLVVDGFFNGAGVTQIRIGRTNPIHESVVSTPEIGATVKIEGDDGTLFDLSGDALGMYTLPAVVVDTSRRFRLTITTTDQKEFASDYVPLRQSPPLDTVRYAVEGDDLQLYLSTHDDSGNTRYYLWKFTETWAYHSQYTSEFKFENGMIMDRIPSNELYYCWSTVHSSQILIGSSAKLEQDLIYDFPIQKMDIHSARLTIKYSILVQQYAVTQEAYEYWGQLKKNTESIGSIFDPQPSQGASNIHCISNPGEPVAGYFSAGLTVEKRIFISTQELPDVRRFTGYEGCQLDTLLLQDVATFDGVQLLAGGIYKLNTLIGYQRTTPFCVDCRLNGGTTVKPDFWK